MNSQLITAGAGIICPAVVLSLGVLSPVRAELNDTGVQLCSDGSTIGVACNSAATGTDVLAGQDGEHGRDVDDPDPTDGKGGFSFVKLDAAGVPLVDQQVSYGDNPWACVSDNVTGLVWEIKTDDGGVHDRDWTYSWYRSDAVNDAGFAGIENAGSCVDTQSCDTEKFAQVVNGAALCGFSDWRVPSPGELLSIAALGDQPLTFPLTPTIDAGYFPNTVAASYLTGVSSAIVNVQAWVVDFAVGTVVTAEKTSGHAVRLVRGGGL